MSAVAKIEKTDIVQVGDTASLMEVIARAAADPAIDVEKLERLMAMAERIEARNAEQSFAAAMTDAQGDMGRVSADATNPQTRSKYASYAALDRVVRPIYSKHGFALSFGTGDAPTPDVVRVICTVSHRAGHSRLYHVDMPADGKGAKGGDVMTKTHAVGAALSYGSRYLLKLIFNVAVGEDDDDGNGASSESGPISASQLAVITDLLVKFDADVPRFCKYMGVEAVKDIPAKQYRKAVESLNLKGKQK